MEGEKEVDIVWCDIGDPGLYLCDRSFRIRRWYPSRGKKVSIEDTSTKLQIMVSFKVEFHSLDAKRKYSIYLVVERGKLGRNDGASI